MAEADDTTQEDKGGRDNDDYHRPERNCTHKTCHTHNVVLMTHSIGHVSQNVNPLTPTVAIWVVGTAIKHREPDRVKPLFVIFDIQAL